MSASMASGSDEFDLKYGVQTAGIVPRWRLLLSSFNAIHGTRYQAVDEEELRAAIDFIKDDLSRFTFVDLGCGKGRALVIAEARNFANIVGVEYNRTLAKIARENVKRATIVRGDAADFVLPAGDLVIFMYNPFSERVMARVVDRISKHIGTTYIIYKKPECAPLFSGFSYLGQIQGTANIFAWKKV